MNYQAATLNKPKCAPFSDKEIAHYKSEFFRDGFLRIPGVLAPEEIAELRADVDRVFEDDRFQDNRYNEYVAVRLFETAPIFGEMLTREPIIGLVESILGSDCHLVAENVVRNKPGQAIDVFHVDDLVIAPLPDEIPRHDPRVTLPIFILTVQIPLTDIPSMEYGPTEYMSGSHYSGRHPNDPKNPIFEGRDPIPVLCKAGDIYLHNGQCWHRGAPNTSTQTRYLFQLAYGQRWVSQRFYPFVNYVMPQEILDRADERRKRVLGVHPRGAYG
jgi:ectoine hydroxylase-related dioxygenase (phytanoyl-CoA dioxygenase family)